MSKRKVLVIDKTTGLEYEPIIRIGMTMACRLRASKMVPVPIDYIECANLKGVIA